MPGRKTHQLVGATAGVAFAAVEAKNQPSQHMCIEMIGGGFGGYAAGMLPDWLEPAICSWHRGICHSATAGAAVLYARATLAQWAQICRQNADRCRMVPQVEDVHTGGWLPLPQTPLQQFCAQLGELFWRFLAGFLNGLAAGYVSHLALDAATPRGIPLLKGRIRNSVFSRDVEVD
jgi:hypothetical protein